MQDEKFISIEYQTWLNKYKPMEEQLIANAKKIKELEEKTSINVYLHWNRMGSSVYYSSFQEIGVLSIEIKNSPIFHNAHIGVVKTAVRDILNNDFGDKERKFVTKDDLDNYEQMLDKLKVLQSEMVKEHNDRIEETKKLKIEREFLEQEKAAIRLPKFLSKLFKYN